MPELRVPSILVAKVSTIPETLVLIGSARNMEEATRRIIDLLPNPLAEIPTFLCKLKGIWRYDFGLPIDLPKMTVVGTHMFTPVERLLDVIGAATGRLSHEQLRDYMLRLAAPEKHQDTLAEFAPVLQLGSEVKTTFEVPGEGARTIDWLIEPNDQPPVLIDVKNRLFDLVQAFARFSEAINDEAQDLEPHHDPAALFRDTVEKFGSRHPHKGLQGAWIITQLKQEADELYRAYSALDSSRLHFAILSNWSNDAYFLARDDVDTANLAGLFAVVHSPAAFTFRRSGR